MLRVEVAESTQYGTMYVHTLYQVHSYELRPQVHVQYRGTSTTTR